ncbi:MAG TPA: helix-turn-helix domain-containing protein [Terracidiphilus sp.]|nr:helix-turn-helix domain-containing protein [Terracidiphilus sp.]
MIDSENTVKYPMLEAILAIQNLPLQPMYTNKDVSKIFKVCVRAIQNWISAGRLTPRNLPGRWKFFPQDLEDFLKSSQKDGHR